MSEGYSVLPFVGKLLKAFGWIGVFAGIVFVFGAGVIEPSLPKHSFGPGDFWEIVGGLLFSLAALCIIAFGEIVGVLFAIEANTRQSSQNNSPLQESK